MDAQLTGPGDAGRCADKPHMNGLRFYPDSVEVDTSGDAPIFVHGSINVARSDFDYIFRPIYPKLASSLFAEERNETSLQCDYQIADLYVRSAVATIPGWHIMPGRLLDRFGKYVQDDWTTLVFFRNGSVHKMIGKVTNHMMLGKPNAFLECSDATTCLHNWDGVYWEVFSKEASVVNALRSAHSGDSHLAMYWVDYEKDFPNPRDTSLQSAERDDAPESR